MTGRKPLRSLFSRASRSSSLALVALAALLGLLATTPTSAAAFSGTFTKDLTFTADVLDPPTGLGSFRNCLSPSYVSLSLNGTAAGTSTVVDRPGSTVPGDVLLAYGVTGGTSPITADAGWTLLHELQSGDASMRGSVWWRRVSSTEPTSYTFSWQVSGLVTITAYANVDSATPVEASGLSGGETTSTSVTSPLLTTSTGQTRVVHNYWVQNVTSVTTPGGVKLRLNSAGFTTGGVMVTADEARPATGSTTARTVSFGTAQYSQGAAVALRAASGNASSIQLGWNATPDTYATGYQLDRGGSSLATLSGRTTTSYTDTTVTDTTSYSYSLAASYFSWRSTAASLTVGTC